jgi:hypothetical protein
MIFRLSRHFLEILLNRKENKKMKSGPGFRPKTTVPEHGVGWRLAVVAGCHDVAAHRVAWPGRHGGPRCTRATGCGHCGRSWCGGAGGHGLPMTPLLRGRGQGYEGGGRDASDKISNSATH